jgi:hypothetical protein
MCSVILSLPSTFLLALVGACNLFFFFEPAYNLLTLGLETVETVPRAMIWSSGENKVTTDIVNVH